MPAQEHVPVDANPRYDEDGYRTHMGPAHVCGACSDFDAGRFVPVSFCSIALAALDAEEEWSLAQQEWIEGGCLGLEPEEPSHMLSADAARWSP